MIHVGDRKRPGAAMCGYSIYDASGGGAMSKNMIGLGDDGGMAVIQISTLQEKVISELRSAGYEISEVVVFLDLGENTNRCEVGSDGVVRWGVEEELVVLPKDCEYSKHMLAETTQPAAPSVGPYLLSWFHDVERYGEYTSDMPWEYKAPHIISAAVRATNLDEAKAIAMMGYANAPEFVQYRYEIAKHARWMPWEEGAIAYRHGVAW